MFTIVQSGSAFSVMARVHANGANVQIADINTITLSIYDKTLEEIIGSPISLIVADTIFDTLQTDARWDVDETGYNFRHNISASLLSDEDIKYILSYVFLTADGTTFKMCPIEVNLKGIF